MRNLMMISVCFVAIFSVALVGADQSMVNFTAVKTPNDEIWCPQKLVNSYTNETLGLKCSTGSFVHYYDCCGAKGGDCCFRLASWVYIALTILTIVSVCLTIVSMCCC